MSDSIAECLIDAGMSETEAQTKATLFAKIERRLPLPFRSEPLRWFVPGRIEVLGKHTDYAGGRSLLCTAERGFCVAAVPREDSMVRINDVARRQTVEFKMSPDLDVPAFGWKVYPSVVVRRLARNFPGTIKGVDVALASDLPSAAGMSSSSALVIAIFTVLSNVNRIAERYEFGKSINDREELAGYLGCIENGQSYKFLAGDNGVGTFGGSEDHTAILFSESGHLKQYSFCPVRLEHTVKVPADCVFVITVSGVVSDKTGSAKALYNRASQAVRSILEIWRTASGANAATLAAVATSSPDAPDYIRALLRQAGRDTESYWLLNRFEQFWRESELIIPQARSALARQDLHTFGKLVDESQVTAEKFLGNQVPETVWLAREARLLGACAASAFGAGFGGSVWALVARNEATEFARRWKASYDRSSHQAAGKSSCFVTAAGPPLIRL